VEMYSVLSGEAYLRRLSLAGPLWLRHWFSSFCKSKYSFRNVRKSNDRDREKPGEKIR
jgi:hypothetical protein